MKKSYSYDEVRTASIDYFGGDELAAETWAGKYALQDCGTYYELTPVEMHRRLSGEFSRIESRYPNPMSEEEIYGLLSSWQVVPQGSPMSAIGNPYQLQSLSNCFVVELRDSYGSILKTDQELVQIMKRRGGVGLDLSSLRPRGIKTNNAAKTTDGIGVFMERFSNTTREVGQGGRRGALMQLLSCHHPQIIDFINIKRDKTKVTGANVSVKWTDEFMQALEDGKTYQQRFPVQKDAVHTFEKNVKAIDVWNEAIKAAYDSAEPGAMFWDTVTKMSPADCYGEHGFETIATNPCSELPLPDADSCRLLLININKFVVDPFTPNARFDYDAFKLVAKKAERLLDDLVDLEIEVVDKIIKKIENDTRTNRR